jgi:hypothetical protein
LIKSRAMLIFGAANLVFALYMTMASRFASLAALVPSWLDHAVNPISKTNLDPLRFVHFVVLAILVVRMLPREWPGFERPVFQPAIVCGQQSLEVFCFGVFLSFAAHFVLVQISNAIWMQILVSIAGIALMTVLAYYRSWSKAMDKRPSKPVPEAAPRPAG